MAEKKEALATATAKAAATLHALNLAKARLAALGLAIFTFICGFIFHGTGTPDDAIHLMKNITMTGGLLFLMLHGAGKFSVDAMLERSSPGLRKVQG